MAYATLDELCAVAEHYEVTLPDDDATAQRALDLASRDLDRHLGASYTLDEVTPVQAAALTDACAIQPASGSSKVPRSRSARTRASRPWAASRTACARCAG
jgi:hypothetical protein